MLRWMSLTVRSRRGAVAALVLLAAGALSAVAHASSTAGGLASRADFSTSCRAAACTYTAGAAVPSTGVIVRWRLRSATTGTARLRVLRTSADGGLETVAVGPVQSLRGHHAPGRDVTYAFNARVVVEKGDALAVDTGHGAAAIFHRRAGASGVSVFTPAGVLDAPASLPGAQLLLSADVEPDADGDGFGDESQDDCPSIANDQTSNPCPSAAVTPTPTPSGDDGGGDDAPPASTGWRRHKHVSEPFGG
jgi:hypothetical protein